MERERFAVDSSVTKEIHQEQEKPLITDFGDKLWNTVRSLTGLKSINFDELPSGEQRQLVLEFLQSYYLQRQREWTLQGRPKEFQSWLAKQVEVNPNLIELTLKDPSQGTEQKLRLAADRKGMLAYFSVLTEQKIERFLDPWISRKELASYAKTHYTLDQLYTHFFKPGAEAGILELSNTKGYRLACDPAKLLEILQSDEPHHILEIVGFESWRREKEFFPILIEDYHLPFLCAVLRLSEGLSPERYLDIPKLRSQTGLSRETVYTDLAELENLGLIKREGPRYRVGDVNLTYVSEIVKAQERPVAIKIKLKKAPSAALGIESRRAIPLEVKKEEEPEFPEISWRESGVDTIDIGQLILDRPRLLRQLDQIMTADFRFKLVYSKDNKFVFSGNLPDNVEPNLKITLGVLDFLGLGPKELDLIEKDLIGTISATITSRLEGSPLLKARLLAAEIKARLAGLILNDVVTTEEGEKLSFASVRSLLDEALAPREPKVEPKEIIIYEKKDEKKEKRETKPRPIINEKLVEVIGKPFERELRSAMGQPSVFVDPQPPTFAFNFHRSLSNKSDFIPWQELFALNLAFPDYEGNYHPHFTPAGALVAALYLDHSVHSRVLALERGENRALKRVAKYIAHLLRARLDEDVGEKEKHYLENCLSTLRQTEVFCGCKDCQKRG